MLGVKPKHQGRKLGYVLVLFVLNYFKIKGYREVFLDTDEFRLPALKTYFNLGFEPFYTEEKDRKRWRDTLHSLGLNDKF
jgi:mycothiol synthase